MNPTQIRAAAPDPRHRPEAIAERILPAEFRRGRGAATNATGRFELQQREAFDDGWTREEAPEPLATEVMWEKPRAIITRNESPDIGFDRSINPYRGCEHGCFYCYARPTHAYMGLSAGLDFETKLFAKEGAAELLERELASPKYKPAPIAFGANTDPYQPIERQYRITRSLIETLAEARHPLTIVTKSNLILRDLDLLAPMARDNLVKVFVSVTTLDRTLARRMEPRAPTPEKRLEAIEALNDAGVPAGVMAAPIVPAINDEELEKILTRAYSAGAREGAYVVLRLPGELRDMFREWLQVNYPDRLKRAVSLMQSMREGKDYEAQWGRRMAGSGPYAWMIGRRFEMAARRLGFRETSRALRTDLFRKPIVEGGATPGRSSACSDEVGGLPGRIRPLPRRGAVSPRAAIRTAELRAPGPRRRRPEGVLPALARPSRQQLGRIAVERQRRGVAHVAWVEADVGEFAAIHFRQRPQRRARGGDAERPGRRSSRLNADYAPHMARGNHGFISFDAPRSDERACGARDSSIQSAQTVPIHWLYSLERTWTIGLPHASRRLRPSSAGA